MKTTRKITINALCIALVFVSTTLLHINIGTSLTNLGDTFIFLSGALFGPFTAFISGSIGSMLADIALGWGHTAIYTFIIKGLEGFIFGLLVNKLRKNKNENQVYNIFMFLSALIGVLIMMSGYFIAEAFFYGSLGVAIVSIYSNILQGALSIVSFLILYNLLINIKFIFNISKEM